MKKAVLLIGLLGLAACSSLNSLGTSTGVKQTKSEEFIDKAKANCEMLGYEKDTKPYLDCTTAQYNKMQERYYGPN